MQFMEVVAESVAGIDVHLKQITVTVLVGSEKMKKPKKVSKRFGTTAPNLRECGAWLVQHDVENVLMESTGQYWGPVWKILEPFGFNMILCNPRIIKNIPGKKTDQKDSEWLSELARYGLVSASYVPSEKIQAMRKTTRSIKTYKELTTSLKQKIQDTLQDSCIKLSSFITDIFSGSGLKLLNMLINGEVITLDSVSRNMNKRMKATPEQILEAMDGELNCADRELIRIDMKSINDISKAIEDLNKLIDEQISEFNDLINRLKDVPGISDISAQVIIAEIGPTVEAFPDAHHLASWAGLCPGNYESGGKKYGSATRHGNVYLKRVLVTAAMGAKNTKDSGLKDYYWRMRARMSSQKALIALAHKLLRIIYSLMESGKTYKEYKKDQRKMVTSASSHI